MNPREVAAYWVEHVLKFGGDHLKSGALDLAWYEYLMLDILGFILVVLMAIIVIATTVIRKCLKHACYGKTTDKSLKTE